MTLLPAACRHEDRRARLLVYLDVIFGGYCIAIAAAALVAWSRGHGGFRTVVALIAFFLLNGVVSEISRRASRPAVVEAGRLAVGAAVAPLAYLAAEAPFGMWWPAFMIMALGGASFFSLSTGRARPGRLISLYYAAALFLTEYLANPRPNWYAFSVGAGATVMVGFLISEVVALLNRALAAERHLHDVKEREQTDRAFRAIVEGTAGTTGGDFFRSLVEHLATALGVDHAFVAEVTDASCARVRTAAFWSNGAIVSNVEYDLAGTPCEAVVAGQLCFYAAGVQAAFPADRDLVTLAAESYLGMPLCDACGEVIGHVAVLDGRPMRDESRRREVLRIFAARAGAEVERHRSDRALRRLNSELEARVIERTAQLQAALDERSRLTAILDATSDVVGMASTDGSLRYLNRAGRERLGVSLDEDITEYQMASFYTPASFEIVTNVGIPTAIQKGTWSGELVLLSRSGEEIPVSCAGTVHVDADGNPRYVSGILRDISETKRITGELQSAKEAAEAASRAKSTFLATMSHEIRTPMNAVIGMTDLLLATPLSPKQREFVETIRAGGDALLTVIDDILDFSKIEAGKLNLEHCPFDLRAALESAVDLLAPRAAEKGLELALSVDPSVPSVVVGDQTRIRQILVNLAGNGIKFTRQGEVVVAVTSRPAGPDSRDIELLFAVRDTGIGIPPEKRDRLFASFSQLDTSTTREYGGTGLGLAISKRLAELMGGTIWVESDGVLGHGSVFQFTVRVGRASSDEQVVRPNARPALAGRRVLVIDDNATNRQILELQMQAWGMLAVQAATPSEALGLLRRGDQFDLVVLDMQMPGMDGVALAKAICAERSAGRLPIVMLTSLGRELGGDAEAIRCFAGRLTKPVKASQLYDAIVAAVVGRTRASDADAARTSPPPSLQPPVAALRILLAEDMEVNRRFALLALEQLGYAADVAANGVEVLLALERTSYDVILMDVQMPEMDGLEATRRIRRTWPAHRQPHIIAMTANAMQGDREMCLEAGMDDYVSKPVYLEELRAVLQRAAERIAGWRTATSDDPVHRRGVPQADHRLLDLFVLEAQEALQQLRDGVITGDGVAVRDAAHRLKGSSGYVGAPAIAGLSARIERAARAGEPVAPGDLEALAHELANFAPAVAASGTGHRIESNGE